MNATEKAYIIAPDYFYREKYNGEADLMLLSELDDRFSYREEVLPALPIVFRQQHVLPSGAGMLTVEGNYSSLAVLSNALVDILNRASRTAVAAFPAKLEGNSDFDYAVIHAPVLDIFDWERSEYDPSKVISAKNGNKFINNVKRYEFTLEQTELPALFRLKSALGPLFIRSDLRSVLNKEGARGIAYMRAGNHSVNNQPVTDIPL